MTQRNHKGLDRFNYDTDLWEYKPEYTPQKNYDYLNAVQTTNGICHSLVIAEKNEKPTNSLSEFAFPTNLQYIASTCGADNWASENFHNFDSTRPPISASFHKAQKPANPHNTDHYQYIGSNF